MEGSNTDMRKTSKVYPWLIPIGFAFVEIATIETILVQSGQFIAAVTQDMGFPVSAFALWITFYSLAMAATMPLVGRLLPKVDSRILLTACVLICIVAMAAMSFYTELWQWYVSGIFIGITGAFVFLVPGPVFINNWFAKKSGFAIGLMGLVMAIGSAIISQVLAFLIQDFGWRDAYVMISILSCVLALPWTLFVIRFKPEEKNMRPYGWEEGMQEIVAEHKKAPGVPAKKAVRTLAFPVLLVACGLGALYGGYVSNWPAMAISWGYTAAVGATMISVGTLFKVLFPLIGMVIDKIGAYKTAYIYCSFMMVSTVALFFHPGETVIYIAVFLFAIQSVNMKMIIPLLVRETFGQKSMARMYSYVQMGVGVIGAFGASIVGLFYDMTGDYSGAFVFGFILALVILMLLLVASSLRKKLIWET